MHSKDTAEVECAVMAILNMATYIHSFPFS